jgi:hypothetical protein
MADYTLIAQKTPKEQNITQIKSNDFLCTKMVKISKESFV